MYSKLNDYKMLTDSVILNSVKFKPLFGNKAEQKLQATLKVIKSETTTASDSEIRTAVLSEMNSYFSIDNWNFGDSFFFTELAAYIHQQNPTILSSVVIMPVSGEAHFGDLFEIRSDSDELFISCARVSDVEIVTNLNPAELRLQ